jgi:hypothetical protein
MHKGHKEAGKVNRFIEPQALLKACVATAIAALLDKGTKLRSKHWELTGRVTIRPTGATNRDSIGNMSGCFEFEVCFEDEDRQMSHCATTVICGEFPAID